MANPDESHDYISFALNQSIVARNPLFRSYLGRKLSTLRAREMSALLCLTSPTFGDVWIGWRLGSLRISRIILASDVILVALPVAMLTVVALGSDLSSDEMVAFTTSFMKTKSLVCRPSPKITGALSRRASRTNRLLTPSYSAHCP